MFHPGETLVHDFIIPFSYGHNNNNDPVISKVIVTYKRANQVVLIKTITSFSSGEEGTHVTVQLTQKESLIFKEKDMFTIQLNIIFTTGARIASDEMKLSSGVQHYKKVITNA